MAKTSKGSRRASPTTKVARNATKRPGKRASIARKPARTATKKVGTRKPATTTSKKVGARRGQGKKATGPKPTVRKAAASKGTKTAGRQRKAGEPSAGAKKQGQPAFGRSGTAGQGEGDEAVQAWIASVRPDQQDLVQLLDRHLSAGASVKAVKWSSPMYGNPGRGWFATMGAFKNFVAVRFFAGAQFNPKPPEGESGQMRSVKYATLADVDAAQLDAWIRQAVALKGWGNA